MPVQRLLKGYALTEGMRSLLQFVIQQILECGFQPSRQEMAEHFRVSKTTIANRLADLARKGYVRVVPGRERGIEVVGLRFRAELTELAGAR